MPQLDKSKGFFTIAQNNTDVDYVRLAYGLALSLKYSQKSISNISIGVTPGTVIDQRYRWAFDEVVEIPWNDDAEDSSWKLENEWKSIWMSPYEETIKLDCDMLFFSDISLWWKQLNKSPNGIIFANRVIDWRGDTVTDDFYRKTFTANKLPNIYSAFTYFRKSPDAFLFFNLIKTITRNWESYFDEFLEPVNRPVNFSTDVAFALAVKILDLDQHFAVDHYFPTFTHMKSKLQGWSGQNLSNDWKTHVTPFLTPDGELKIGNHLQVYPLHYHIKEFLTDDMIDTYEKLVKS